MPSPGFAETNVFLAVLEQKSFTKAPKLLGSRQPRPALNALVDFLRHPAKRRKAAANFIES